MLIFGNIHFAEFLRGNLKATGNSSWVAVARLERWSNPPPPGLSIRDLNWSFSFFCVCIFQFNIYFFEKLKYSPRLKIKKLWKAIEVSLLSFVSWQKHMAHTQNP